jgi:hypothetical protein
MSLFLFFESRQIYSLISPKEDLGVFLTGADNE